MRPLNRSRLETLTAPAPALVALPNERGWPLQQYERLVLASLGADPIRDEARRAMLRTLRGFVPTAGSLEAAFIEPLETELADLLEKP